MQNSLDISLNAVRVFLLVAEHGSIKRAAEVLHVTPGAVSHQVRILEDGLGVQLLRRANNSIDLTPVGQQLFREGSPGSDLLHGVIDRIRRDANELRVHVSLSFATRWLIPRLQDFQARNPAARVRVETTHSIDSKPDPDADVSIQYFSQSRIPDGSQVLFQDICRPYVSPALLTGSHRVEDYPAIQATQDNWDWTLWRKGAGLGAAKLQMATRVDLDDAALRAAIAGLGMVLTSEFMIADDLANGHLCPLPDSPEVLLGAYVIHQSARQTGLSQRFVDWLHKSAGAVR
ncbi:LysR substrate-binding domain-containing protein [Tateyamaria sp. SN3-11]|uniref:LysR substrate-binding domain-containing protein n=1 Tax=Tateyamaria sp. SN3-11 TaxID=3092147 RepID=UPI0039E75F87